MKLELKKAVDGTHFVIAVVCERERRQVVIPLSQALSGEIQRMVNVDGVKAEKLILPPRMSAH